MNWRTEMRPAPLTLRFPLDYLLSAVMHIKLRGTADILSVLLSRHGLPCELPAGTIVCQLQVQFLKMSNMPRTCSAGIPRLPPSKESPL